MHILSFFLAIWALLDFDIESTASKLNNAYKYDDYEAFVDAFPTNFEDFLNLYGYDKFEGGRILYYDSCKHIQYLFSERRIIDSNRLDLLINLSYGFKWGVDASSCLQDESQRLVKNYPQNIAEWLILKKDSDIISFFRMCLTELIKDYSTDLYNTFIKEYSPISPRITKLIKAAYVLALEDSDKIVVE